MQLPDVPYRFIFSFHFPQLLDPSSRSQPRAGRPQGSQGTSSRAPRAARAGGVPRLRIPLFLPPRVPGSERTFGESRAVLPETSRACGTDLFLGILRVMMIIIAVVINIAAYPGNLNVVPPLKEREPAGP